MLIMPNPWIEHVKTYAKEHNITYGEAISQAKETYVKKERHSGGSRNSNIVRVLEGKKKLNINKVKNPSANLITRHKKQLIQPPQQPKQQPTEPKQQPKQPEVPKKPEAPNYIERLHKKYPSTNIPNLKNADKWIREKFIDNGFASNYEFAMRESVSIPTKRSLKSNPHGNQGKIDAQNNRIAQADAQALVKPLIPTFHQAMKNALMVEIFSNIIVDKYLIGILDTDKIFRAAFSLTYKLKSVITDNEKDRQKIKDLVKQG